MKFAEPYWLWVGAAVCLFLFWRFRRHDRGRHRALTRFVAPHLAAELTRSTSRLRRNLKRVFYLAGVVLAFVALARPQAGYRWQMTHRKGLDILFAVDTSKSMLVQDVKPDRLDRARLAVEDLLNKLDGDGVGLIAFSGAAFLQCPLTLDYDAFRDSLDALDTDIIPRGGTDIASAIREAEDAFRGHSDSDRILVLLSDGEDLSGDAIVAARKAAAEGITIFTVGVGTPNGDLIPVKDAQGRTEFLKDSSGQFVKSRLDEATLRNVAGATGGLYEPLGRQGQGLTAIYTDGFASFQRHELAARRHRVPLERFEWPLGLALLCFVLDWLIGTRRLSTGRRPNRAASRRASAWLRPRPAALAGLMLSVLLPAGARASPQSAEKAYLKGDFAKARSEYAASAARKPADARLQFNLGAANYMSRDYAKAEQGFEGALKTDEVPVQQNAYYSLGNTHYRIGQETEQTDPAKTIQVWQQALKSYDAALQINPEDADARFNRDLVKQKLERLQQQQAGNEKRDQSQNRNQNRNRNRNQLRADQQTQSSQRAKAGQQKQNHAQQEQPQTASAGTNAHKARPPGTAQDRTPEESAAQPKAQPEVDRAHALPQPAGESSADREPERDALTDARRQPGEMSREEARELLNSLRNEERHLPPVAAFDNSGNGREQQPLKDW